MATLEKLQISGIRSFGPYEEHTQQIKFTTPVTLILGQNGCGKTTIIEAIKYACSTDLLGGQKSGGSFVHDPKISRTSSTKGQIKLKILDPRGDEVTVIRVLESMLCAKSIKYSLKSSTIRRVTPDKKETSITGRCADITTECCQLMNVSPAVLNNVIFCHQEHSLWPLEEGQKLKEKFDEIFDAQKYNKCTDIVRKNVKEKQEKIKLLEAHLAFRKEKKEQAEKMNRTLEDKEDRVKVFDDDIKTKNEELDVVKTRMNEIFELEGALANLEKELTMKEATIRGVIEEQNTIKKNLPFEFEGNDKELQDKIESFEKERRREENLIAELETRKTDIDNKNKLVVVAIQEAQTEVGRLNEQKNQYVQKCLERTNLLEQAKITMDMKDLNKFSNNEGARTAVTELRNELETQEMYLMSLIDEKEEEHSKLQNDIDKAREITVTLRQHVSSKEKEVTDCETKISNISCELISLKNVDCFLEETKKRLETIDRTVHSLNKGLNEGEENKKIESYKRDIQSMERDLESLDGEYRILQQNDVTEGKIESEMQLIMEKQQEIRRIKSKHSESFRQLFDGTIPMKNLRDAVLEKSKTADSLVKTLTEDIAKAQKEVTTLEVQRNNQQEKIANCEKELQANRNKISQACNGREFNDILNSTFEKKERLQIDKGQYSSVRIIYGQFIKKFQEESPCCPVCETNFSNNKNVVQKIISTLKSKLEKVPQQLTKVENDLLKEETLYNKLQQLKLVNDEVQSLEKEKLPKLKQSLNEIEQNLKTKMEQLNLLKEKLHEPQKTVEICNTVISDVGSLDQNISDVDKSQQTVGHLKRSLRHVASKQSKQEVEAKIDYIKSEIAELRGKLDAVTKNINNHKDRIHQLMQERRDVSEKEARLKENIQKRPLLEEQKIELDKKVTTLKEQIMKFQFELSIQQDKFNAAVENKNNVTKANKKLIDQQREKILTYGKIIQALDKLQNEIDEYLSGDIDSKIITTENRLKECRDKESALDAAKTKVINAISEKKEDLAKEELRFRTLQTNIVLRQKKTQETKLKSEIQDLKTRIGGYNYRTVYEEKRRLEMKRENLEKQTNNLLGEKRGIQDYINELRQELSKPENRKAYSNYMEKFYEIKLNQRVLDDMRQFIVALEKAILEFHKSKMVQINRTIRHLWRNTYRGNDIDHIEIKTEYATGSATKRSYNYKVVQIKKGIELDMRGRCSAGQKVLACLIIRMALAETLSSNCGILALDEPTTNLDRANIFSLSDTLARIIDTRHKEKTFQLVIITHDEEFLNALTRAQGVNHYYKVDRDKDGYSVITKHNVGLN